MAIKKVTDLTELTTTAASDDLVVIVDVDDTTDSPEGTSKKIQVSNLSSGIGVSSVNGQTGVVVLDADDIDDTATTNKFTTASDIAKLSGIETGADVTDATNVTSSLVSATSISAGDKTTIQSNLDVDPAGTDNSTDVTANANVNDVIGMGANQVMRATDAGGDKLVFWDDSAGKLTYATIGTNLTMADTTLNASGGGGGGGTNQMMIPWAFFDSTLRDVYIPITSELENTSLQRYNKFVAPFAGSLSACTIFGTSNQTGGTGVTLTIAKQTGTNVYTDQESVTLSSLTAYQASTFTFSTNSFAAGDVLVFELTNGFSAAFGNLTGTLLFTVS